MLTINLSLFRISILFDIDYREMWNTVYDPKSSFGISSNNSFRMASRTTIFFVFRYIVVEYPKKVLNEKYES